MLVDAALSGLTLAIFPQFEGTRNARERALQWWKTNQNTERNGLDHSLQFVFYNLPFVFWDFTNYPAA